jgi:prephenate dehydrogenase
MTGTQEDSVVIGVVGGEGQMGRWLRRFWQDRGHQVVFSDRQTALSSEEVVCRAGLTVVAVPLQSTPAVLRSLAPLASEQSALVSIASLMAPSAEALAESPGETLCAHPVFGPTVGSIRGLPVVVAPVRGERWSAWLVASLREAGMAVRVSTPAEHDASMAVVQAMLHSLYVALTTAMDTSGLPVREALAWASPTLRLQLGLMARILGQDPELYADLVVGNALAPDCLDALAGALGHLATLARDGDRAGFAAAFRAARDAFGAGGPELAARAEEALERFS